MTSSKSTLFLYGFVKCIQTQVKLEQKRDVVEVKGKSRRAYGHVTRSYGIKLCVKSSKPIHICSNKTCVIYKFRRKKKERDWINITKNTNLNIMIG